MLPLISLAIVLTNTPPAIVHAADGDLDSTFGIGGIVITDFGHDEDVSALVIQNDGKIIAIGSAISGQGFTLARYDANGALDPTFGTVGKVVTNFFNSTQTANTAVLQIDGKVIVGGTAFKIDHYVFALARYNVDGSLDSSFGSGGTVAFDLIASDQASAISLRQDGKIVAVGNSFSNGLLGVTIARYNPDGSLDSSFGVGGKVLVNTTLTGPRLASAFQPDNKIILGGFTVPFGSNGSDFTLLRLNQDGGVDMSFGTNGQVATDFSQSNDAVNALALQSDGKIVAAGRTDTANPVLTHSGLVRYNSNGTLDGTFGIGGKVFSALDPSFDEVKAVAVQKDGRILTAGHSLGGLLVARYDVNGSLDQTFGTGGLTTTHIGDINLAEARNLAIQSDGKIIAAGLAFNFNTGLDFALVRLQGTSFDVCLKDDSNGNLLQANLTSGAYQFTTCKGVAFGGTASIIKKGCYATLQVNGPDRRLMAKVDTCLKIGTASIQVLSLGSTFTITDRNTANSTCSCGQ